MPLARHGTTAEDTCATTWAVSGNRQEQHRAAHLEAEALDFVEVEARLLRRDVVRGHAGDDAVARVLRRVKRQRALPRPQLRGQHKKIRQASKLVL